MSRNASWWSRDVGAYLGLVPRRYQSGEVDYTGSISKRGDRRVRTLLYEAANVMLTRYRGKLALKDWALAIGRRSTMRKARIALARRLAIIMPPCSGTAQSSDPLRFSAAGDRRPRRAPERSTARGRAWVMAPMLSHAVDPMTDCGFNQATPHPADPIECHRARREHRNPKAVHQCSGLEWPPLDLLENSIG